MFYLHIFSVWGWFSAAFDDRIKELESHLEDFDAVQLELDSVERDYMIELSKYDQEKMLMERAAAEAKDTEMRLRQQIEGLQKRLEQSQREVQDARRMSLRRDPEQEKAAQAELERLSMTIVGSFFLAYLFILHIYFFEIFF